MINSREYYYLYKNQKDVLCAALDKSTTTVNKPPIWLKTLVLPL